MCISFLTADRQSQVMKSTERHFFQNTERTYHCIIMHIFKKKQKQKQKQSIIKLNKQSIIKLNKQSINLT